MDKVFKKALKKAGNEIALRRRRTICQATSLEDLDIKACKEFTAFCPQLPNDLGMCSYFWWGTKTMNAWEGHEKCYHARLLGIAFMITMPEDMVPE